ncbi:MAG: glycosyltransferase [Sulfuritalea sp.]|nr:glycosyltransferase [Sulfuritalea sp.]
MASVIILTKNGEQYFRSLLDGLYCQKGIDRAEVIVIDSGSLDNTLRIVEDFPAIRLVEIPAHEFGHGKTRNLGARLAQGEYLVYLPQDATPMGTEWLANLLRPFDNPEVVGVFGRQVARADASSMERFFLSRTYHEHPQIKMLGTGEDASLARCFFSTVSGAIRASAWACHAFREDIIMSEDQAWASEVMCDGHSIAYEPNAKVLHSHQYGIADIFRRNFDSGYSIWQIFRGVTGIKPTAALANIASEAIFVARRGSAMDWLIFLPYEMARHAGFWLGLRADSLPGRLNRVCSNLKYFWEQPARAKGPHQ